MSGERNNNTDTTENNVILFPDYEKLKKEVERLKTELSMHLYEYDELRLVVCKNIEAEYLRELGGLEYQIFETECTVRRLMRKVDLIQARINRQEPVVLKEIEAILEEEFLVYQQQLDEMIGKINKAIECGEKKRLSDADDKEIKKLYRSIVKALHPDLHPNQSQERMDLFHNAVRAYEHGDLAMIRLIHSIVSGKPDAEAEDKDPMTYLREEKARLEQSLQTIEEKMEEIKSKYPYTMREILEDKEKLRAKREEYETVLTEYRETEKRYRERVKSLLQ